MPKPTVKDFEALKAENTALKAEIAALRAARAATMAKLSALQDQIETKLRELKRPGPRLVTSKNRFERPLK